MQLNLAGLVLATLTICNRRVQVANLIGFEAVNFGPEAGFRQVHHSGTGKRLFIQDLGPPLLRTLKLNAD
jgi:hypothetical protein